jgi:plastocyanin
MRRLIRFLLLTPFLLLIGFAAGGVPVTAGGGCHGGSGATATEGGSTVVKIDGCTFAPTVTRVPVGTEVTFLNTSPGPHDVTGRMGEWGSDLLQAGASFKHRFASAGIFAYSCSLHPGMAGVVVAGGPNAALTSEVVPTAAESVPAPADAGLQPLPLVASGALGLVLGALGMAAVRRRTFVEP